MKIIGIDGNEANVKRRVGVNKYAFEIIWGIYRLQDKLKDEIKIIVYLKKRPQKNLPPPRENFVYKIIPGERLWVIKKLMPYLFLTKERPNVFFAPTHYIPPLAPMPRVCSVMDLGYLKFSEQFLKSDLWQLKVWTAISIFCAKKIFSISETTKRDILRHYPFASKKVVVTLLGYDRDFCETKISEKLVRRVKKKYTIANNYILFIGTLKPSKNINGLIKAWAKICNKFPDTQLVIAGKKGWLYENIYEEIQSLKIEKRVVFTDFITDQEKLVLLKRAKAFVIPSFWEGFGLDCLNAVACGIPVVASNVGSLKEILKDAAVFVDPYNVEDIAEKIERVLMMGKKEYNLLLRKGKKILKVFSWEKTAKKTLDELIKII